MEKIKAALIGCGRMGAFTSKDVKSYAPKCWFPLSHLEALKTSDSIEIVAISDFSKNNLDRAKKL